jgi:hypothetical protein
MSDLGATSAIGIFAAIFIGILSKIFGSNFVFDLRSIGLFVAGGAVFYLLSLSGKLSVQVERLF